MRNRITVFIPIRGIAAVLIVLSHMNFIWEKVPTFYFLSNGNFNVILFFMISGFVLMFRYDDSMNEKITFNIYFAFLKKRLKKLYTLYISSQIVFFLFVIAGEFFLKKGGIQVFIKYFFQLLLSSTMLQTIIPFESTCLILNDSLWFISTLFVLYLLTPVLIRYINYVLKNNSLSKNALSIIGIILIYIAFLYGIFPVVSSYLQNLFPNENIVLSFTTPYINIFYFVIGMLLYKLYAIIHEKKLEEKITFSSATFLEIILSILLIYLNFTFKNRILNTIAITLWIVFMALQKGLVSKILCNCKFISFLGKISLHIYIVHYIFTVIFTYIFQKIFPDNYMSFFTLIILEWILIILSGYILFEIQVHFTHRKMLF